MTWQTPFFSTKKQNPAGKWRGFDEPR